jgi:hypothetical protein
VALKTRQAGGGWHVLNQCVSINALVPAFRIFHLWFQSEANRPENEVQLRNRFDAEDSL